MDLWSDVSAVPAASDYYRDALLTDYIGDGAALSEFNPTPGSGKTGILYNIPPNNYPFYAPSEIYTPKMQTDGGQWSETRKMYNPSADEAEADRLRAYQTGIPHGFTPQPQATGTDSGSASVLLKLTVSSTYFRSHEYGPEEREDGTHYGGPFAITVPASIRVDALKQIVQDEGGVPIALQKLSYAGKKLMDPNRTLEQYGVAYWNARFPQWELKLLSV